MHAHTYTHTHNCFVYTYHDVSLQISDTVSPARDPLADILSLYPAFLTASAESWDSSQQSFMDLSGNGRVGTLQAGAVSVGSVSGNGANWSVPYVGGTRETQISWGTASIPSTFTICSITRYSGAAKLRILQCRDRNWLHGHYGYWSTYAGATWYDGPGELDYTISPNTNWVVACGRNIQTAGSAGTIINGVVTSTAEGGAGNCELTINQGPGFLDASDWQLSKVYVWNMNLPDAVFVDASARLNSYLEGAATVRLLALSLSRLNTHTHTHTHTRYTLISVCRCRFQTAQQSRCRFQTAQVRDPSRVCLAQPANTRTSHRLSRAWRVRLMLRRQRGAWLSRTAPATPDGPGPTHTCTSD
jgi:hypothetical protein